MRISFVSSSWRACCSACSAAAIGIRIGFGCALALRTFTSFPAAVQGLGGRPRPE